MTTILVTGATGLVGSNICQAARNRGWTPRALVRPGSRLDELQALGAEFAWGDIRNAEEMQAAAKGADYVAHTAALVPGGAPAELAEFEAINDLGTRNVLNAARSAGARRFVYFTTGIHNADGSLVPPERLAEPYAATKAAGFRAVEQAVDEGYEAVTICPGAVIGPAPTLGRAVEAPGFNSRIILAIHGEIETFPPFNITPVLGYDVARATLDALERGRSGEVFDTSGLQMDAVELMNRGCEVAGVPHRVRALTEEELGSEAVQKRWGTAISRVAREALQARRAGETKPSSLHPLTVERLNYEPTSLADTVRTTVQWMQQHGLV
jgi:nucleoside-diphosphate-sugar epimerase